MPLPPETPPSRTSRDGLPRTDLRRQARLRSLAVAAGAGSTGWMAAALVEVTAPHRPRAQVVGTGSAGR